MSETNFEQLRFYIIKTLEKLADDVETLKSITNSRAEYITKFEEIQRDVKLLEKQLKALEIQSSVYGTKLMFIGAAAGMIGSGVIALVIKLIV